MSDKKIYLRILLNLFVTVALSILALIFLPRILSFFFPFVLAFILSLIANPVIRFMDKRIRIKRRFASVIIIVLVIGVIFGLLYLIGSLIITQALRLIQDLPRLAKELTNVMDDLTIRLAVFLKGLPYGIRSLFDGVDKNVENWLIQFIQKIDIPSFKEAGSFLKLAGEFMFTGIITVLATYFMIADKEKMNQAANRIFPESIKSGYHLVVTNFKAAVGGYLKAQFKIMLLLIVIMYFAFLLLNIEYAFLLAIIIGVIDFLPVLGMGIVIWPWAIVDFITENYVQAILILVLYLVCQVIKQVLEPKLIADSIGISPFMSLLFMFIGYQLKGFLGMMLGMPIGMVFLSLYRLGMFDRLIRGFQIIIHDIDEYRKY